MATNVGKQALRGFLTVGLFGSAVSLNFGGTMIKIFQIIEVFGKLHYLPTPFSVFLDSYLEMINGLSDLIEIPADLLFGEQESKEGSPYRYKLTKNRQEKLLLRSLLLNSLLYLTLRFLQAIFSALSLFVRRKRVVCTILDNLTNFVLEVSLIDFFFQCVVSLLNM